MSDFEGWEYSVEDLRDGGFRTTESAIEQFNRLNAFASTRTLNEKERRALDKAYRDAVDEWRNLQQPPKPPKPKPPAPRPAVPKPPPKESKPTVQDSAEAQAAPDVKEEQPVDNKVLADRSPSEDKVPRKTCGEAHWGQYSAKPAEQVASLADPPPTSEAESAELTDLIKHNEQTVPGEPHPTHADPFSRTPTAEADPVDLFTGAFTLSVVDLVVPSAVSSIQFERSYRSGRPYFGPCGYGWDHSYNVYLRRLNDGRIALWNGRLGEQSFLPDGNGWVCQAAMAATIKPLASPADGFEVTYARGVRWRFQRPTGWGHAERIPLVAIFDRHGNTLQLTYDTADCLASVLDEAGRGVLFQYGHCGLLERVSDHTGTRVVGYKHHDEIEHLVGVTLPATAEFPVGITTRYDYDLYADHPAMRHNILCVTDARGRIYLENEYAGPEVGWAFNTVTRQLAGGYEYLFEYEQLQWVAPDEAFVQDLATRTSVSLPDGSLHTYTFNYRGDMLDHRFRLNADGSFRVTTSQWEHDAEGNVTKTVGPDGLRKFFTYDSTNTNPCARHNLLRVEIAAPLSGMVASRVLYQGQYEPRYQLATKTKDEIGAETRFFYDFDVNPIGATGRLAQIQLPAVVGADGVPQQSNLLFEHNAHGQLTATVKPEGGRTELTYISGGVHDGFLSRITEDPTTAGLVSKFEYDAAGFPTQLQAPGGRITGFTHNALGQVEEITAPEVGGQTAPVRRWFDDSGSIVRLERPAGSSAAGVMQGTSIIDEYERDEIGSVRRVTLAGNTVNRSQWLQKVDHEGRAVSVWDPSGTRHDRVFGENGALLSETAAAGDSVAQKTSYSHDRAGRVRQIVGPVKDATRFEYDVWGRPHRITLPNGAVRTLEFGANDRVLEERVEDFPTGAVTPRLLHRQTYEYDKRRRLISKTLSSFRDIPATAVPLKTRYLYDRDDNVRAVLLPRGAQYQYDFDKIERLTKTTDPHGNVRQFVYDASGDLSELSVTEIENGVVRATTHRNTYDARGRLDRSEYLGTVAQFHYDDRDLLIEQHTPTGVTNRLQYDALGQVIENLIDPGGAALRSQFEYDLNGRLRRYIDPTGQSTTWKRDAIGRAVAIKPPDGTTWEYLTDTNARRIEQRMPSGNKVAIEYAEDESRPIKIVCVAAPGQEAVAPRELAYDGMGRLVRASIGADSLLRRYDSLGRLIEETTRGKTVRMEYDDAAGSTDLVFPDGRRERTEHNPASQPTRIVLATPGALGGTVGDVLLEIVYSTAGRPVRLIYGNGVEGQLVHDDQGRVIRIEYQKGGVLLDSCRLRYDEGGHRAVVQYLGAPSRNLVHRFDSHERLVESRSGFPLAPLPDVTTAAAQAVDVAAARIAAAVAPGVVFTLDDADTRTKVTGLNGGAANENYVSTNDHRVTAVGASTISYNPDGTRTGDVRYEYELDALNRVRRVRDRATNAIVSELRYDPLSRVAAGTTDGQEFERWFAGSTRIHEVSGLGTGASRQHSSHPLWPSPLCVIDAAGPAYIHQDEGWSTMCVTDAAGAVLERHRYDIFGASAAFAADGVTPLASLRTEPMWRGMPALGTTTLFRTPQRLYDSEIGVFTSRDPLLYADSPSPYAYAAHNPVDFADPTGLTKSPLGELAPSSKPSTPDWTTQTEWVFPRPDHRLMQPVTSVDTGNRPLNFLANKVLLPWRNVLAFYGNIPLAAWFGTEDALEHSQFKQAYHAAQVMFPMENAMGIAIEAGPAMQYAGTWLSAMFTNRRLIAAHTDFVLMLMGGVVGTGGSSSSALRGTIKASNLGAIGTTTSRATFRRILTKLIQDVKHPLHKLLDPQTGKLRPSTTRGISELDWLENPEIVEVGHDASAKQLAGTADRLMVMSAYENRKISAVLEHPSKGGAMLESGTVFEIGGAPIDATTAVDLVTKGVVDAQHLDNARIVKYSKEQ